MSKMKSILILSAAAMCLSATPSFAQYGSGSSYGNQTPRTSAPSSVRKAKKTISRADKRRIEAQRQKEIIEARLAAKDKAAQSYGSGTKPAETSYGSDTKPAGTSYGSGTKSSAHVVKDNTSSYGPLTKPSNGSHHASPAASQGGLPTNCPAGTKAQSNGTCLLTSGSLPRS